MGACFRVTTASINRTRHFFLSKWLPDKIRGYLGCLILNCFCLHLKAPIVMPTGAMLFFSASAKQELWQAAAVMKGVLFCDRLVIMLFVAGAPPVVPLVVPHHCNGLLHKRCPHHCPIKDHIFLPAQVSPVSQPMYTVNHQDQAFLSRED